MKVVVLEPLKCTGCRACEYACSFAHTGLFNPLDSRIKINTFLEDLSFIPSICMQCEEPYCMEVCPTGALTKNAETGVVEFERNRCIGCKQCIIACPWGSIKLNHTGREIIKCDYCGGDPECIKVCAARALTFEEVEDMVTAKQKKVATKYKEIAKEIARGVNP
ncbi:MAG: 4Fe-4S dicluster domain-containing protein [Deltaproteobacteria bacterium]|nr:4Fe-4S dicluster domain-containing protein [Deltaproteobacteria bacterium]